MRINIIKTSIYFIYRRFYDPYIYDLKISNEIMLRDLNNFLIIFDFSIF